MNARVEVNTSGELFIVLPDEIVEDMQIEVGEPVHIEEVDGVVELTFG